MSNIPIVKHNLRVTYFNHHNITNHENTLVNNGSDNGLFPDGTQPQPGPMLTYNQWGPVTITPGQFHRRYISYESANLAWKWHIKKSNRISQCQWHNFPVVQAFHIFVKSMTVTFSCSWLFLTSYDLKFKLSGKRGFTRFEMSFLLCRFVCCGSPVSRLQLLWGDVYR